MSILFVLYVFTHLQSAPVRPSGVDSRIPFQGLVPPVLDFKPMRWAWWIHVHDFDSGDRIISRTTWRHHAERLYGMFCCSVFYLQLRALFFVEQYQILLIRHTKLDLGPKYIELHSIPSHHPSDPHFIAQRANLLHCQVLSSQKLYLSIIKTFASISISSDSFP